VEYVSDRVVVNIYHDRPSFELGVEIGLRDDGSRLDRAIDSAQSFAKVGRPTAEYEFSLDEIVQLLDAATGDSSSFAPFASTPQEVESLVPRLGEGLRRHARHLLAGNHQDFDDLAMRRSESAREFTQDLEFRQVRREAERAWREKRFPVVVELLGRLGNEISPVERKRLQYSLARLGEGR
jgi:hypothetical protein